MTKLWRRIISGTVTVAVACVASVFYAPQLLAFPFRADIGRYHVYSESPIPEPAMRAVLARADARLAASPINRPHDDVALFLTHGGLRWRLLSLSSNGAFALTRGIGGSILVNRNSIAMDQVENGQNPGGVRALSDVIAHEETHNLLRRHFGLLVDVTTPVWKREGYCDFVAGSSSLNDAEAADLERRNIGHPALPYYHGRKRVAAALAANGGSVDALFAQ